MMFLEREYIIEKVTWIVQRPDINIFSEMRLVSPACHTVRDPVPFSEGGIRVC